MKVDIHVFALNSYTPVYKGFIDTETFNAEELFTLCNWASYSDEKPRQLYSDIESCGHGVCFTNPETGEWWLAKSYGWLNGSMNDVVAYVKKNKRNIVWE